AALVRRDPLESADGDGLFLHPPASAGRLARPVTDAAEDAREHVRLPVEHVGIVEPPLGDQPNITGHVGVRGASPLTIDDTVVVLGVAGRCRLHPQDAPSRVPPPGPGVPASIAGSTGKYTPSSRQRAARPLR